MGSEVPTQSKYTLTRNRKLDSFKGVPSNLGGTSSFIFLQPITPETAPVPITGAIGYYAEDYAAACCCYTFYKAVA